MPFSNPAPLLGAARDGDERQAELALLWDVATLVTSRPRPAGLLLRVGTNPIDPAVEREISWYVAGPGVRVLAADRLHRAATVRTR